MKPISLFSLPEVKNGLSERGELLKYFASKINKPIGYVAFKLTGFKLHDLYYLKSIADDAERRGDSWAKVWYGSIKNRG